MLEMWSLHFLLLVVVIDIANEEISLYLCLILSMFFLVSRLVMLQLRYQIC